MAAPATVSDAAGTGAAATASTEALPSAAVLRFELRGVGDERVTAAPDAAALTLSGIGEDFEFLSGGRLAHGPGGGARA